MDVLFMRVLFFLFFIMYEIDERPEQWAQHGMYVVALKLFGSKSKKINW